MNCFTSTLKLQRIAVSMKSSWSLIISFCSTCQLNRVIVTYETHSGHLDLMSMLVLNVKYLMN